MWIFDNICTVSAKCYSKTLWMGILDLKTPISG